MEMSDQHHAPAVNRRQGGTQKECLSLQETDPWSSNTELVTLLTELMSWQAHKMKTNLAIWTELNGKVSFNEDVIIS
jgi:hypothetical protein